MILSFIVARSFEEIQALIQALDAERERQGITKAQLARMSELPKVSIRRLFTRSADDIKLSTILKIARALGASISLDLIDAGLDRDQSNQLLNRLRRRHEAEQIARRKRLDPGDVEHALFNLTLSPTERLTRSFARAGLRHQRR